MTKEEELELSYLLAEAKETMKELEIQRSNKDDPEGRKLCRKETELAKSNYLRSIAILSPEELAEKKAKSEADNAAMRLENNQHPELMVMLLDISDKHLIKTRGKHPNKPL